MTIYLFFTDTADYTPIEHLNETDAIEDAKLTDGVTHITDMQGCLIWTIGDSNG